MTGTPEVGREIAHDSTRIPAALLRGGLLPLALTAVLLGVLAAVRGGAPALVAALAGAGLAAAALAVGPGLLAWSARTAPHLMLVMALMGYAVTIILLGAVLLVLRTSTWLAHGYLSAGLILATLSWLLGQVWTVIRLRIPAFGTATVGGTAADGAPGTVADPGEPGRPDTRW